MTTIADFTVDTNTGDQLDLSEKARQGAAGGEHRKQVRFHPAV